MYFVKIDVKFEGKDGENCLSDVRNESEIEEREREREKDAKTQTRETS